MLPLGVRPKIPANLPTACFNEPLEWFSDTDSLAQAFDSPFPWRFGCPEDVPSI